jgi:hypothetical protein
VDLETERRAGERFEGGVAGAERGEGGRTLGGCTSGGESRRRAVKCVQAANKREQRGEKKRDDAGFLASFESARRQRWTFSLLSLSLCTTTTTEMIRQYTPCGAVFAQLSPSSSSFERGEEREKIK